MNRAPHLPPVSEASRTIRCRIILAAAVAGYLMALLPNLVGVPDALAAWLGLR